MIKIDIKNQLILAIAGFILTAIFFVGAHVAIIEDEQDRQNIEDNYYKTKATVIEAGEVKRSNSGIAPTWSQQCLIEYETPNGKVLQTNFEAGKYTTPNPVEVGDVLEVYVLPDNYQAVKSAHHASSPNFMCFAIFAIGIYGVLIIKLIIKYKNSMEKKDGEECI